MWKELLRFVIHHHVSVVTDTSMPSLFSSGKITPVTYSTIYPLSNAMDGLCALERRETWGKAVVRVRGEDQAVAKL